MTVLRTAGQPRALVGRLARSMHLRPGGQGTAAQAPLPGALLELARNGPAPLTGVGRADNEVLHIAAIIPSFRRGSGGHATIVRLLDGLRERGHEVSVWLEDCEGRHGAESPGLTRRSFREFFAAESLELQTDMEAWDGADVVLATGWQTVPRALLLTGTGARAYLVQDHEPDFYGASAEALWAAETYRQGLHCIAASGWLAALLRERYGASATHFDLAVDHAVYRTTDGDDGSGRRTNLLLFYARAVTPRRAVPLGLLALSELTRRRPEVEIVLFGEDRPLGAGFPHHNLGILDESSLAALYREATVGMVLSLTNPSLIGLQMMASGLPCVELASESMTASFGREGPLTLAEPEPLALAEALESLLGDAAPRVVAARNAELLVRERTWESAAIQVEQGLRMAIARRRP